MLKLKKGLNIWIFILIFGLACLAAPAFGLAAAHKVDMDQFIRETQKSSMDAGRLTLVWWIPLDFWQTAFDQTPDISKADVEFFLSILRPYTVVAILDGTVASANKIKYRSEEEIRSAVQLIDGEKRNYQPLKNEEISSGAKVLLKQFKPVVERLVGKEAKNICFVLFGAKGNGDGAVIDPAKEGNFTIRLDNKEFKWRLPLPSLVPPKKCPVCSEEWNGAYKYCPWDGTKLPD
ncbi:MAG: hypothetical protein ACM3X9_13530 [Bacillota bacterium]